MKSISVEQFPIGASLDEDAIKQFGFIQNIVRGVRTLKAEHKVSKKIKLFVTQIDDVSKKVIEDNQAVLISLAKLEAIEFSLAAEGTKFMVPALKPGTNAEFKVELFSSIEERGNTQKEIDRLKTTVKNQELKLSNVNFVERAPKEVVEKERIKLQEAKDHLEKLLNKG